MLVEKQPSEHQKYGSWTNAFPEFSAKVVCGSTPHLGCIVTAAASTTVGVSRLVIVSLAGVCGSTLQHRNSIVMHSSLAQCPAVWARGN